MEVSPFAFAVKEKSYASKRNLKFRSSLESVRCLTTERSNVNSNLPLCHLVKAEQGLNGELVAPAAWRCLPRSADSSLLSNLAADRRGEMPSAIKPPHDCSYC